MDLRWVAASLIAFSTAIDAAPGYVYPGKAWERIGDPAGAGWSPKGLEEFRRELARTETTGLVAIHGGRVLVEYGDVKRPMDVNSVRKSLLSTLYGNHVANGQIRLDSTLAELRIDDIGGLSAGEKRATVRDLLSARSGVYHPAANLGDDQPKAPPRDSQPPGAFFLYNNWDFNALGTIFEQRTKRNLYDAFDAELAKPLAMQDFDRRQQKKSGDPSRSIHPAYHFHISTRDLARIGYLMLREGNWAGTQLVPRDWVKESTHIVTPVLQMNLAKDRKGPLGYGYLWWVWDSWWSKGAFEGAFTAHGIRGQHLTVLPALDLVVAHETGKDAKHPLSHEGFFRLVGMLADARCPRTPCGR